METLVKDIRYGLRSLVKRRGFTLIAVFTLALGIGASTAIFSVVDGVLLRSLPYPQAEQIVQLREVNSKGGRIRFTEPNYLDVRARSHAFEAIAQYAGDLTIVNGANEPVRAYAFAVSGDFFKVLGVKPIVGRTFAAEESKRGGAPHSYGAGSAVQRRAEAGAGKGNVAGGDWCDHRSGRRLCTDARNVTLALRSYAN